MSWGFAWSFPLWIEGRAVFSYLSLTTGFDSATAKLSHCSDEGCVKVIRIISEIVDSGLRCWVSEEHFIWSQQPHPCNQILVINVVESLWGHRIEVDRDSRVHVLRTPLHQLLGIGCVQRRVYLRGCGEVVEPICKAAAVGEAEGVSPGQCDHVKLSEVVLGKEGIELVEIEEGLWQVSGNVKCLRYESVETAQFYIERRTSGLQRFLI